MRNRAGRDAGKYSVVVVADAEEEKAGEDADLEGADGRRGDVTGADGRAGDEEGADEEGAGEPVVAAVAPPVVAGDAVEPVVAAVGSVAESVSSVPTAAALGWGA
ncbi:MAG: hypothetical protein M3Z00_11575 [Actinomycetota bacterium]|nr:hypothetical protein [Actinomycetota bacterium]